RRRQAAPAAVHGAPAVSEDRMHTIPARSVALAALALGLGLPARPASAEPPPGPASYDLRVRRLPAPRDLHMRVAQNAGPPPSERNAATGTRARTTRSNAGDARDDRLPPQAQPPRLRVPLPLFAGPRLDERVIFRFNLGVGFDDGEPAPEGQLQSGAELDEREYARLRIHYFGDAIIGSRGLLVPSLSTYMAAQFRFDQAPEPEPTARPVPSVYDRRTADGRSVSRRQIRTAYAQLDGFLDHRELTPLFVRAGRQYRYGPAIAHFDGLTVGYDRPALSLGAYGGRSVDNFGVARLIIPGVDSTEMDSDGSPRTGLITGVDGRVDLYRLRRLPLVLSASVMRFAGRSHARGDLAVSWSRDVAISAGVRTLGMAVARQSATVRARISEVTTVHVELDNRTASDWMYDLFTIERPDEADAPRRYLDLGPPLPRLHATLRAGTVLVDNIDVLLRAAAAIERDRSGQAPNPHATSFIEGGGAIEIRPRRSIALGLSGLVRRYVREGTVIDDDESLVADALPADLGASGERSFAEGGSSLRFTQGARTLTASAEVYLRFYQGRFAYPGVPRSADELRGGGRFAIELWPSDRLRLKLEYDVTSSFINAPELTGVKSLRVLTEGQF
ncbi:MAG: hypothetical protein AAGC55_11380, partial [Myxococcota bacterium]